MLKIKYKILKETLVFAVIMEKYFFWPIFYQNYADFCF